MNGRREVYSCVCVCFASVFGRHEWVFLGGGVGGEGLGVYMRACRCLFCAWGRRREGGDEHLACVCLIACTCTCTCEQQSLRAGMQKSMCLHVYLRRYMSASVYAKVRVCVCTCVRVLYTCPCKCWAYAKGKIAPVFGASSRVRDKIGANPRVLAWSVFRLSKRIRGAY